MKTLRLILLMTVVVTAITALSFTVVPASYARDGNNYYREDSRGVYSPGYMNAAVYHARYVIEQNSDQDKSGLIERLISYMQYKTQANMESAKAEMAEVTPALQLKASGPKAAVAQVADLQAQGEKKDTARSFGDLDGNGMVGISDLNIVLGTWHVRGKFTKNGMIYTEMPYNSAGDVNNDGIVDEKDLNIVLKHYGTEVPDNKK